MRFSDHDWADGFIYGVLACLLVLGGLFCLRHWLVAHRVTSCLYNEQGEHCSTTFHWNMTEWIPPP